MNRGLRETCPETDDEITVVSAVYGPPKADALIFFFFDINGIARAHPRFRRPSSELPSPGSLGAILLYSDVRWPHAVWGFTSCKDPLNV